MARRGVYRAVYSALFDDPDYQHLTSGARLLLLTLRQCSDAGPAAIFRYYPEKLAVQTGLSVAKVTTTLRELVAGGWIAFRYPIVWVRNGLRYDPTVSLANPKHAAYVRKWVEGLPRNEIVVKFCEYYEIVYPFDRVSVPIHPEPDPEPDPDTENTGTTLSRAATVPHRGSDNGTDPAISLLDFLNRKTGRHYRPVASTLGPIRARLRSGATLEQLRAVIAVKCREWRDSDMAQYLRPATLFRASNFESYLGQLPATAFVEES